MAFQVSVTHGFLLTPFCHWAAGSAGDTREKGETLQRKEQEQSVARERIKGKPGGLR